jgi:predicted NAD/FAD-dependent oxidoreductase
MRIAIIGAGMAGLSCAAGLRANGHETVLFDKGRGAGGRMSTARLQTSLGEVAFDHGAQFFTARDPDFAAEVDRWHDAGIVAPWSAAGADVWVGTPSMNAPIRAMADATDVGWRSKIDALRNSDGWYLGGDDVAEGPFDAVLLAVPAEQVSPLVDAHAADMAAKARSVPSDPCWTVMVAFDRPVSFGEDCIRHAGIVSWAARNSAKPGRHGPEAWVIQGSGDWSRDHIEDDALQVEKALLAAFAERVGAALPGAVALRTHRWRYAKSGALGPGALWNADTALGACGDWLLGGRVEQAWVSGRRLAAMIG